MECPDEQDQNSITSGFTPINGSSAVPINWKTEFHRQRLDLGSVTEVSSPGPPGASRPSKRARVTNRRKSRGPSLGILDLSTTESSPNPPGQPGKPSTQSHSHDLPNVGTATLAPSSLSPIIALDGTRWENRDGDNHQEWATSDLVEDAMTSLNAQSLAARLFGQTSDNIGMLVNDNLEDDLEASWDEFFNLNTVDDTKGIGPKSPSPSPSPSHVFINSPQVNEQPQATPLTPDGYSMCDLEEAELCHLLDGPTPHQQQASPYGVAYDANAGEYEATASRTYLFPSLPPSGQTPAPDTPESEADLIIDDIDWDALMLASSNLSKKATSQTKYPDGSQDDFQFRPFARPPFPEPVSPRPLVTGLCPTSVTRTCFRTGELLNANTACRRAKKDGVVVFELFARVAESYRETTSKTQHFQFKDMFADNGPRLTGTLQDWKSGGVTDVQAQELVGPAGRSRRSLDPVCRVVCRVKRREAAAIGWALEVLRIRSTDWEEVEWVRRVIARDG